MSIENSPPEPGNSQVSDKVSVTMNVKLSLKDRVIKFFKGLRFDKQFVKRWKYGMWVQAAFFAQGFLGLITLTLFRKNLTATPSGYLAAQRAVCAQVLREEKEKAQAEEAGEVYNKESKVFDDIDDEMGAFLDNLSTKHEYNSKGKLKETK